MQLTSSAFRHGESIPQQFTCEGDNTSPEFSWKEAPKETKSFVFLIHDPDAPRKDGFAHWVLYNIAADVADLVANVPRRPVVPGVGLQGKNDSGKIGYTGPCPPSGTHRYFARVYALKQKLDLQPGATYKDVIAAMEGKIIEQAELMGTYAKAIQRAA
ncbi:MAG TPA: YbhB/YbcL family Raf kinase inhibitor-like protein [Terriglobales bacterium]|nr:YbhB/YbcL family Raf kinase inhibitor-like protein [Terriglobales bacterium]